jgi:hypothetical protein
LPARVITQLYPRTLLHEVVTENNRQQGCRADKAWLQVRTRPVARYDLPHKVCHDASVGFSPSSASLESLTRMISRIGCLLRRRDPKFLLHPTTSVNPIYKHGLEYYIPSDRIASYGKSQKVGCPNNKACGCLKRHNSSGRRADSNSCTECRQVKVRQRSHLHGIPTRFMKLIYLSSLRATRRRLFQRPVPDVRPESSTAN